MKLRPLVLMLLALCVAAAPASAAETVLLADDMEGEIGAKWVVGESTNPTTIEPWQKSNSTAPKVRGNQANGGATSYWAGPTPEGQHPADPTEGETHLTSKASIIIPADGKTTVSFFSLFQNEGDDAGNFEVALISDTKSKNAWKKVAGVKLVTSSATDPAYVSGYCNTRPEVHTQGFEEITGDLSAFAGKEVFVRFNYKLGNENRQTSYPCGWYVDDLKITTTGTPGKTGAPATPTTAPPTTTDPKPAKSSVKMSGFKAKGKKATLKLQVMGGAVSKGVVTLLKGKKRVAVAKLGATIDPGAPLPVTLKLKKKLKKGRYVLKFKGTGADGGSVAATVKVKAR